MTSLSTTILRAFLAIGLSFALWAFVSFSQNPEETVRFEDLPLQVVGLQPGLLLVDTNGLPSPALPAVDITLSTDRAQRNALRPVDIRAVLDLSRLGPGEHSVPVNIQPTRSNISFTVPDSGVEPTVVSVRIEQEITRTVPLDLRVIGNLPFSFERGEPEITSGGEELATIEVSGPQSRVERVQAARATANIEQLRASYDAPLTLEAVDEGGQPVEGVTLTPSVVTVLIPINPVVGLKLVPVQPLVVGEPAPGFEVMAVEVEPLLVAITGSSGPLDDVDALSTEAVTIGGAQDAVERSVPIVFPPGTSPRVGEPTRVRVVVRVRPITRAFQAQLPAQVNLVGLGSGVLVSANPSLVTLTVSGPTTALEALASAPLRADVDVSGLAPGVYQLPVAVTLPEGVSLAGPPPTVTVTVRLPPTAVPTETAEPAETPGTSPTATSEETPTAEPPTETPAPPTPTPTP